MTSSKVRASSVPRLCRSCDALCASEFCAECLDTPKSHDRGWRTHIPGFDREVFASDERAEVEREIQRAWMDSENEAAAYIARRRGLIEAR